MGHSTNSIVRICLLCFFFFFKQKTAYEISECDWRSDVCASDLRTVMDGATTCHGQVKKASRIDTFKCLTFKKMIESRKMICAYSNKQVQIGRASCGVRVLGLVEGPVVTATKKSNDISNVSQSLV